jgi:stage V sporulation protein AE
MIYLYSFLFAGVVCLISELLMDNTKLTPGHITTIFVVLGAFLDMFNIYDKLILICGGGALVPITSFGHLLIHGALEAAGTYGIMGLVMGMFNLTASGICSAIIFSFFLSLIFKPRD